MKSNWQNSTHKNIATTNFWNEKWKAGHTGWDIGGASPPILDYLSQYKNKEVAILIPGCGNAHEAKYLSENGFKNITLLDIAPEAVSRLKRNFEDKPEIKILCKDFFNHQGNYDLIIEQTFFCALLPEKRKEYVQKIHNLLNPGGKLAGLLFNREFDRDEPPFGGNREAYESLFAPYFELKIMEPCLNSIPPRAGTELFIVFQKKKLRAN